MKRKGLWGMMMLVAVWVIYQMQNLSSKDVSPPTSPSLITNTDNTSQPSPLAGRALIQTEGSQLNAIQIPSTRKLPNLSADGVITQTTLAVKNDARYVHKTHLPYANPSAPKGGELIMSAKGSFNSLNAFIDKGEPAAGTFYLYDTLMTGSLDESFVLYPQLASAATYNPSDTSWVVYHLNPKARFWDGTAVLADDVKATFELILRGGLMSWRGFLAGIEGIEVLDEHRVLFYFNESASSTLYANVALMPIFAKTDIQKRFHEVSLTPLMGSGAYQVGRVDSPRSIEYHRDVHYWGATKEAGVMANVGRFNFDVIKFIYYQDDDVAKEAFLAGVFNYRQETDVKAWAKFDPSFIRINTKEPIIKTAITHTNPVTMRGLVMNRRRPLLADKTLRQAMILAFDWKWANEHLFYGQYERLTSFFYGSELMAMGLPTTEEQNILKTLPLNDEEQSVWKVPFLPDGAGDGINRENLLLARKMLLDAGFYYQNGRLYDKMGRHVMMEILVKDDQYQALLFAYTRNLERLGMTVSVRQVNGDVYLAKKRRFDYDLIIDEFMQGNSPGA